MKWAVQGIFTYENKNWLMAFMHKKYRQAASVNNITITKLSNAMAKEGQETYSAHTKTTIFMSTYNTDLY